MINLIFHENNFDAEWAYESLRNILTPDKQVLVFPLFFNEEWSEDLENFEHRYRKGSRAYEKIAAPFRNYLFKDDHLHFLTLNQEDAQSLKTKIANTDILYLIGNNPVTMMEVIEDYGLQKTLLEYDGIVIGNAAGSTVMMDEFLPDEEWDREKKPGIGYLRGFMLDAGYEEDAYHLQKIIRSLQEEGKAVFGCPKNGGILIQDGHYELLGDAFAADDNDLDNIYHAYEDARSRLEYYGDNGNW